MQIRKLSDSVIKKICAGEVITRPYNVLKELLENSIDAEATCVSIRISKDVLSIEVDDNGIGIRKEDFPLLCKRNCTSKIQTEADLFTIGSYGFRGEALSSIAEVSKVKVKSRPRDQEFGYTGIFNNDNLVEQNPIGMEDGTSISIKDIFFNNKIREKYYFKKTKELENMVDMVYSYCIKHPHIKFNLIVGEKSRFCIKNESLT